MLWLPRMRGRLYAKAVPPCKEEKPRPRRCPADRVGRRVPPAWCDHYPLAEDIVERAMLTLCGLLCLAQQPGLSVEARRETASFVRGLQAPDGGFLPSPRRGDAAALSRLRATTAALRALCYCAGEAPNRDACRRFVASC